MVLKTEHIPTRPKIHIRPTTTDDLDFVLAAEAAPENSRFVIPWSHERHLAALADSDLAHRVVERIDDAHRVGFVLLAGLNNPHQSIEFRRIVITDKGQGYGKQAIRLVKAAAFNAFRCHRLWLDVMVLNTRAQTLYRQAGFQVEGTLRDCLKTEAGYESLIVLSILAHEYYTTAPTIDSS